jgi:protocatechuate 3,4-dioxygenase beta subunit
MMRMCRRDLLVFSAAAVLVPGRASAQVPPVYLSTKYVAPKGVPARIAISPGEPGERLIVTGRVLDFPRGIAGASLYIFHADREGRYTRDREGPNTDENARLHGALRTDAEGRFRYETIRPAGYGANGAHIHYVVNHPDYKTRMEELRLADDPEAFASPAEVRGLKSGARQPSTAFPDYVFAMLPVEQDKQEVWHITHDIYLERQ